MLKKIALLLRIEDNAKEYDLFYLLTAANRKNIEVKIFDKSEEIDAFEPDCVIVFSPEDAKLTRFPTYGLINKDIQHYLQLPRYTRNLLMYDGYLTTSARNKELLGDLLFGARKLDSTIAFFSITPFSYKVETVKRPSTKKVLVINNSTQTINCSALLNQINYPDIIVEAAQTPHPQHAGEEIQPVAANEEDYLAVIFLDVNNSDFISNRLLTLIAKGIPVICAHSKALEQHFGDNLYYLDNKLDPATAAQQIGAYIDVIMSGKQAALTKAQNAQAIFEKTFALEVMLDNLAKLHESTLLHKGYLPDSVKLLKNGDNLSVSYIIRTGGKHRDYLERALDSLVNQTYKNIQVIFVIHANFYYLPELLEKYKALKPQVVEYLKSIRSDAIAAGINAVTTDYFGLLDDDDELHPNHVFNLIKTLEYHDRRDSRGPIRLAYSGSIIVHDSEAVKERPEYLDSQYKSRNEKRVTEHFRFYRHHEMAAHHWFMMSNSWLASRELVDSEILTQPGIDTCEDLYFELQFAQRTYFAFSAEMTAVHHYHSRGNSSFVDSHRHIADTQRIGLRNFSRQYHGEFIYDSPYMLIGKPNNANTIIIPQFLSAKLAPVMQANYFYNPLAPSSPVKTGTRPFKLINFMWSGVKIGPLAVIRYLSLDAQAREHLKQRARETWAREGLQGLIRRTSDQARVAQYYIAQKRIQSPRVFKSSINQLIEKLSTLPVIKGLVKNRE